ncbi:MAG: DEAD/DEAH box helicase [Deltaproteobacteria bacterium]|nr:DEAD/DEAH box helicase [Deltaproteobacteria bacterium]
MSSFHQFSLLSSLVKSLSEQGFTRPTDIQVRAIPPLMEGKGVVGVAETGSGKTLAYVLPMLHCLKVLETEGAPVSEPGRPRGLVLVPGRELGAQVGKVFKSLTHGTRLRVRTVLGGTKKQIARQNVAGNLEILVATPGRLLQLLDSRELRLDDVRMLIMDEADRLLDAGFLPVADRVLSSCPRGVQIGMLSATFPQTLQGLLADVYDVPPVVVRTKGSGRMLATLTTDNRALSKGARFELLREVLNETVDGGTLLFANTRRQCEAVAEWLDDEGILYGRYMGEMDRRERTRNLERFRDGELDLLLATDLGGRGIDIDRIARVVNVHLPGDVDTYLHRAGRTARAGRPGVVVNFVTHRDEGLMQKLRKREQRK